MSTSNYYRLQQEFEVVNKYKKLSHKDQVINDVAMLVIHDGKIFLSKRMLHPGLGLWSLPTGSIVGSESVEESLFRNFDRNNVVLENNGSVVYTKLPTVIFDYESRSLLGRVISHVGVFVVGSKLNIKNNSSNWLDSHLITETMCDKMYNDHYQIISILLDKYNISTKGRFL
jgi:bifunctional NMN adenylyltransferase/nudix hydrolase